MKRRYIFWAACALLGLAIGSGLSLAMVWKRTAPFIYPDVASVPTTTVAMVLGASVRQNGQLSPVLAQRADRAVELYVAGKVRKILVTGDNGDLSHNEVNPTGKYLLGRGVPREDIFLDHAGFDTYSSMYRARDVFEIYSVTIVSQPFHLARAVLIARALGLEAYGEEAGGGEPFRYNTIREIPATLKAMCDLAFSRTPKYLGTPFPISGNGSSTWSD